MLSGEIVFEIPDSLEDAIDYNPATLLEDGQWYLIAGFSAKEYCIAMLNDDSFDSVDYQQLGSESFEKLDYLISYQNGVFFFQKISRSQLVRKKEYALEIRTGLKEVRR